jgi:hypothetical protein
MHHKKQTKTRQKKTKQLSDPFRIRVKIQIFDQRKITNPVITHLKEDLQRSYRSVLYLKVDLAQSQRLQSSRHYCGVLTVLEHKDYQRILENTEIVMQRFPHLRLLILDRMTTQNERKVYVTNIPKKVSNNELSQIFSRFGEVIKAFIINPNFKKGKKNSKNPNNDLKKFATRAGIVLFKNRYSVDDALRIGSVFLKGKLISVNEFRAKRVQSFDQFGHAQAAVHFNSHLRMDRPPTRRRMRQTESRAHQTAFGPKGHLRMVPRFRRRRENEFELIDLHGFNWSTLQYIKQISKRNRFSENHNCENIKLNLGKAPFARKGNHSSSSF